MKEFLVGLLVLFLVGVLSLLGVFLFPMLLIIGISFRLVLSFVLVLFAIWFVGKITLILIEFLTKK